MDTGVESFEVTVTGVESFEVTVTGVESFEVTVTGVESFEVAVVSVYTCLCCSVLATHTLGLTQSFPNL
jgi:hypothetical protein